MAGIGNEMQFSYIPAKTCYFLLRDRNSQIFNTNTNLFESYSTANFLAGYYAIIATEQGTASAYFTGTIPTTVPAGVYEIVAKCKETGSYLESDPTVATGSVEWNGTARPPLSDMTTSGQLASFFPMKPYRGQMILNFPVYLVSSADGRTPFTSGVISGQINRDGGGWGPLQSGAFTEQGLGWYKLQALTSGDLNAGTVALVFTGARLSGGTSDPRNFSFIMQRISGY